MKKTFLQICALLLCIFISISGQIKAQNDELNGKTFAIKLTHKGERPGMEWNTDEVSFNSNMLKSKLMNEHEHFPITECTIKIDSSASGEKISFKTKMKNPGGSKIVWDGSVSGNTIEGTAVWTNMQGTQSYSFTGTLKAK